MRTLSALAAKKEWLDPILQWQLWTLPFIVSILLIIIAQYNFLTFHTLVELFAIIISFIMFSLAWTTYDFSKNLVLLFLACGYVWIGSLDLLHTLSYKGMNLFVHDGGNMGSQLWIGARYCEALLLFTAPLLAPKAFNKYGLIIVFGSAALCISIMVFLDIFPTTFIDGVGLTPFKIYSEYIIISILCLALFSVFHYGHTISHEEKVLIATSIILTMCAELAFTFYVDVYGLSNIVGHTFKLFSYWLIFHAIILSNLKAPYASLHESQNKLSVALYEANRANQAKSSFLASMSHDLRTPLNAIIGFSDMMRMKAFGPLGNSRYEEYANDIHNSGTLLISLVNDILDLSKIESGKYKLAEDKLNIAALIQLSFRQLSFMAETSGHTLTANVPTDMPDMLGDERVMMQILNNLISNAIKFTPEKGEITILTTVNTNNCITFSVTDTGVGMSADEITKALKLFEQVDSTLARKHEGSGLGLYLCSNFMTLFGGTLEIQSTTGMGTAIMLYFPAERTLSSQS